MCAGLLGSPVQTHPGTPCSLQSVHRYVSLAWGLVSLSSFLVLLLCLLLSPLTFWSGPMCGSLVILVLTGFQSLQ